MNGFYEASILCGVKANDPTLSLHLARVKQDLQKVLSADKESVQVQKVERSTNVRLVLRLPSNAVQRLRFLAEKNPESLRSLGIQAVHLAGSFNRSKTTAAAVAALIGRPDRPFAPTARGGCVAVGSNFAKQQVVRSGSLNCNSTMNANFNPSTNLYGDEHQGQNLNVFQAPSATDSNGAYLAYFEQPSTSNAVYVENMTAQQAQFVYQQQSGEYGVTYSNNEQAVQYLQESNGSYGAMIQPPTEQRFYAGNDQQIGGWTSAVTYSESPDNNGNSYWAYQDYGGGGVRAPVQYYENVPNNGQVLVQQVPLIGQQHVNTNNNSPLLVNLLQQQSPPHHQQPQQLVGADHQPPGSAAGGKKRRKNAASTPSAKATKAAKNAAAKVAHAAPSFGPPLTPSAMPAPSFDRMALQHQQAMALQRQQQQASYQHNVSLSSQAIAAPSLPFGGATTFISPQQVQTHGILHGRESISAGMPSSIVPSSPYLLASSPLKQTAPSGANGPFGNVGQTPLSAAAAFSLPPSSTPQGCTSAALSTVSLTSMRSPTTAVPTSPMSAASIFSTIDSVLHRAMETASPTPVTPKQPSGAEAPPTPSRQMSGGDESAADGPLVAVPQQQQQQSRQSSGRGKGADLNAFQSSSKNQKIHSHATNARSPGQNAIVRFANAGAGATTVGQNFSSPVVMHQQPGHSPQILLTQQQQQRLQLQQQQQQFSMQQQQQLSYQQQMRHVYYADDQHQQQQIYAQPQQMLGQHQQPLAAFRPSGQQGQWSNAGQHQQFSQQQPVMQIFYAQSQQPQQRSQIQQPLDNYAVSQQGAPPWLLQQQQQQHLAGTAGAPQPPAYGSAVGCAPPTVVTSTVADGGKKGTAVPSVLYNGQGGGCHQTAGGSNDEIDEFANIGIADLNFIADPQRHTQALPQHYLGNDFSCSTFSVGDPPAMPSSDQFKRRPPPPTTDFIFTSATATASAVVATPVNNGATSSLASIGQPGGNDGSASAQWPTTAVLVGNHPAAFLTATKEWRVAPFDDAKSAASMRPVGAPAQASNALHGAKAAPSSW